MASLVASRTSFNADTTRYLKQVAAILKEKGFTAYQDRKGKDEKTVSSNKAGPAGSGEVSLYMRKGNFGVYVQVGAFNLRGMGGKPHPQGVSILARTTHSAEKDKYATNGSNQWLGTETTAGELADFLTKYAPAEVPAPVTIEEKPAPAPAEVAKPEETAPAPAKSESKPDRWSATDLQTILDLLDKGRIVLVADGGELGIPTIQDMPSDATKHMGFGTFRTETDDYDANWDGRRRDAAHAGRSNRLHRGQHGPRHAADEPLRPGSDQGHATRQAR